MLSALKNKDWVFVLSISTKSATNFMIASLKYPLLINSILVNFGFG
jgi:hypothetical protein